MLRTTDQGLGTSALEAPNHGYIFSAGTDAGVSRITDLAAVRPVRIDDDDHPDIRRPSWCWVVASNPDGYQHDIDEEHIETAVHTTEEPVNTRASLYRADRESDGRVCTATFESICSKAEAGGPPSARHSASGRCGGRATGGSERSIAM